jgi:hypothetical protein
MYIKLHSPTYYEHYFLIKKRKNILPYYFNYSTFSYIINITK